MVPYGIGRNYVKNIIFSSLIKKTPKNHASSIAYEKLSNTFKML